MCKKAVAKGAKNGDKCSVLQTIANKMADGMVTLSQCTGTFEESDSSRRQLATGRKRQLLGNAISGWNFGCCSVAYLYLAGFMPDTADCSANGSWNSSPPWVSTNPIKDATNEYWGVTKKTGLSTCCEHHDKALYPGDKGDHVGVGSSAGNAADDALFSCVTKVIADGTACANLESKADRDWCIGVADEIMLAMPMHPNGRR